MGSRGKERGRTESTQYMPPRKVDFSRGAPHQSMSIIHVRTLEVCRCPYGVTLSAFNVTYCLFGELHLVDQPKPIS